jgi:Tol biopolymer transport system component
MRTWLAAVGLLVAAACIAEPVQAQYFGRNKVQYEDFTFKTLETEHFIFHFYPEEEKAVRDAARMAERWYDRHSQLFLREFQEKKPIIFYANDADFQQTNVTEQRIGPGTGGFTESLRERVVMPLSPSYGETNHVLGHELVHSFQYDLALNTELGISPNALPLWVIEGMAEYLSVGREDSHTAMWMRDAVLYDNMPSFEALANPREYFPYRYGQAFLAYIGGKYGDQAVTDLYKRGGAIGGGRGSQLAALDSAFVSLYGVRGDSLTKEWAEATRRAYEPLMTDRTHPDSLGQVVLSKEKNGGEINISPVLSPDGQYVAFMSERNIFNFTIHVADAETGEVIADLDAAGTTRHFNALRFISSAGAWSPDGTRLAFVSYEDGDNQITVWNVNDEDIEQSYKVQGVTSMKNPAWSPDGDRLAFTGTDGGISDLYVLDLQTKKVRQLTNDRYADLQPTWSPDGERLAFTTDRGDTNLQLLAPTKAMNLGLIDVESGDITLRQPFGDAHHHNPQFSPDGRSLYFVSDQDGFKDVYRLNLQSEDLFRVTHLKTGVSGITAKSPAMSVAARSGEMMMSVYNDNTYTGVRLSAEAAQGEPLGAEVANTAPPNAEAIGETVAAGEAPADTSDTTARPDAAASDTTDAPLAGTLPASSSKRAGVLPPYSSTSQGLVASYLSDEESGLPPASKEYETEDFDPSLTLEAITPARVGAQVGGFYGSGVQGGIAALFGDMLGNQKMIVSLQAQGSFRDIGGGVQYVNRGNQLNWGGTLSHTPILYDIQSVPFGRGTGVFIERRLQLSQAGFNTSYPLSTSRRFEFNIGGSRYGYGVNVREIGPTNLTSPFGEDVSLDELQQEFGESRIPDESDTQYLANASLAYVRDFSQSALTGPVKGGRWRVEVGPTVGSQNFVTTRLDFRRYFYAKPFTFALQALHVGNYGASFNTDFGPGTFGPGNEYIGYPYGQGFVRGYNVREIAEDVRTRNANCTVLEESNGGFLGTQCAEIERLFGSRMATARAEIRVPLLGPDRISLIPFPYLPTTLAVFGDAGVTWDDEKFADFVFETEPSTALNIPVTSAGVAARFNVLGRILLEAYYAKPFQLPDTNWEFGLRISPGW